MIELFGPLQRVVVVFGLWLVPLPPLVAAAVILGCRLALGEGRARAKLERVSAIAAVAGGGLALLAAVGHAIALALREEEERYLLTHLFRMVRIGQLDVSFDLGFDPLAAVACVTIALVATAACVSEVLRKTADARAWISLAAGAMMAMVLAEDLFVFLVAASAVAVALGVCAMSVDAARFVVHATGGAALLVGATLVFWGMGGVFATDEYVPELEPRFAAVGIGTAETVGASDADDGVPHPPSMTGKGYVTLASYPGAIVYVDESWLPLSDSAGRVLRAPFARVPLAGGVHTFRVHPGDGLDDFLVTHVAIGGEREVSLALFGPTTSFRLLRDQLVVRDARGVFAARERLLEKRVSGVSLVTIACLLFVVAAIAMSRSAPARSPAAAAFVQSVAAASGVFLLARVAFLLAESRAASTALAVFGAVCAVASGIAAAVATDARRVLARVTGAQVGIMLLAVGGGAYAGAVFHFAVHAVAMTCLVLTAAARREALEDDAGNDLAKLADAPACAPAVRRAYLVACVALAGAPIPGLGAFWSRDEALARVALSEAVRPLPAGVLVAAGLVAAAATSFALFRSYFLGFASSEAADATPRAEAILLRGLAYASAAIGLLFGFGAAPRVLFAFAGDADSIMASFLAPVFATARVSFARDDSRAVRVIVATLAFGASISAWKVARDRYGAARPKDWRAREEKSVAARIARGAPRFTFGDAIARATRRASHVARDLDRWVIDGVVGGVANGVRALAWVSARADVGIVDASMAGAGASAAAIGDALRAAQGARLRRFVGILVATTCALVALYYTMLKR